MTQNYSDLNPLSDCSYCKSTRKVNNMETGENGIIENEAKNYKHAFKVGLLRVDDLENMLDAGYARYAESVFMTSNHKSCCEVWQYRVNVDDFKMSNNQKKVIRRFHRYLNYGNIHGEDKVEESKNEE